MDKDSICVIYLESDGKQWASYVQNELQLLKIPIQTVDFEQQRTQPSIATVDFMKRTAITIIIFTPQLGDLIYNDENANFHSICAEVSNGIILFVGEGVSTFEDLKLAQRLPNYDPDRWKLCEFKGDWKRVELVITKEYDDAVASFQLEIQSRPEPKPIKIRPEKVERNEMTIIPNQVRCEVYGNLVYSSAV